MQRQQRSAPHIEITFVILSAPVELVLWHTVCWLLLAMPFFQIFSRQLRMLSSIDRRKQSMAKNETHREKNWHSQKYSIVLLQSVLPLLSIRLCQIKKNCFFFSYVYCKALTKSPKNNTQTHPNFTMKRENYEKTVTIYLLKIVHTSKTVLN